ncbi:unnamed protein product [Mucor hiemalis]
MNWQDLVASATGNRPPNSSNLPTDSNHEYSDNDEYTDNDYESVEMAAWGDSAKKEEPATWNSLVDTSIKVKAGGVGSGDLHRRGGNFKPLSEETILAQRLNKPIPGKKNAAKPPGAGLKKKKKKGIKPATAPTTASKFASARKPYIPAPIYKLPERKPAANAPPSTWGSKPLVEIPFWEVQKNSGPQPSTPIPSASTNTIDPAPKTLNPVNSTTTVNPVLTTVNPIQNTGVNFVSITTKPVKGEPVSIGVNTSPIFNPKAAGFIPKAEKAVGKWNTEAPSFSPSPSSTLSAKSNVTTDSLLSVPTPTPSRPLSSTAKTNPLLNKQLSNINKSVSRETEKPYFTITLEIAEGISAVINLYQDSDPVQVAEEFGKKHSLIVTETTKANLARTFSQLLTAKKNKEQLRQA